MCNFAELTHLNLWAACDTVCHNRQLFCCLPLLCRPHIVRGSWLDIWYCWQGLLLGICGGTKVFKEFILYIIHCLAPTGALYVVLWSYIPNDGKQDTLRLSLGPAPVSRQSLLIITVVAISCNTMQCVRELEGVAQKCSTGRNRETGECATRLVQQQLRPCSLQLNENLKWNGCKILRVEYSYNTCTLYIWVAETIAIVLNQLVVNYSQKWGVANNHRISMTYVYMYTCRRKWHHYHLVGGTI